MKEEKSWLPDKAIRDSWKGTWRDDWRVMGQEGYLKGKTLVHRHFDRSICREDFLQCEFCWKSLEDAAGKGVLCFFEPLQKLWVCETCFEDFKAHFDWTVVEGTEK